ncbi:thiol reductant ABC exporter subunit CydD [Schaalia sp. 19OD2882]|uniref:thiol reductant ABC exporter subunit CydD n=1 Tax=Schaalia sp. 19OD2882 TaxID=2794089 RepID=UPI001C1E96C4|nr:thiol reductant ABC exporter subunit CydD [Schaalia sp. 19OD2882]QWW18902.1 thiol reductant ABC exporter subunit CydD [Schaalia sp. 19OD2882]
MRPVDPRLLRYARSARTHIAFQALLGTVTAGLVISQAVLIASVLSPLVQGTATLPDLATRLAALVAVVSARALVVAWREATSNRAAEHTIRELRAAVIDHAIALGPRWRARHGADTATLVTRGLDDLTPWFVRFLPQLVLVCTVTPLALATILWLDPVSAVVAAVVVPLIPVFMILVGRFTEKSSSARLVAMQRLSSQLLDLLAGLPTLRGLHRQRGPETHLARLGRQNTATTMATLRVAFLSGAVLEFLATLSVALVAVESGFRLVYGHIDLFTGLAVIMLAPEVFEPLRQVGTQFHASANGVAAAQRAFEVLETPLPAGHGSCPAEPCLHAPEAGRTTILCEQLSVAARGVWAPADLEATIRPGRLTALVGPSGGGKSTTMACLLGLTRPTRGRILLQDEDGTRVDLAEVDPTTWWSQLAWIPQSPVLVPGTLRDNLPADATDGDLDRAARATGFDEVLAGLPHGWDSPVGRGGVGLSVGQRQRLALVAALVGEAPLVFLDEPTAHLDAVSEEVVTSTLEALRAQGRTLVVIAHRESLVALADEVIEVHPRRAGEQEVAAHPELAAADALEAIDIHAPQLLDPKAAEPPPATRRDDTEGGRV